MAEKRVLLDLTLDELKAYLAELGQPAFRAGQVFQWASQRRRLCADAKHSQGASLSA